MKGKLYKYIAMLLVIVLILGTLTGCQMALKAKAFEPINTDTVLKEYKDAVTVETLDQDFIDGLNRFSLQLFSKQRDGENVLISPYSIATALAMLYNGSDHETRNEMAQMLGYDKLEGFTKDYNEAANQYMNANNLYLMEAMQKADSKVKINVGNSIWMSLNGEFSENMDRALLAPVRYYYDGDIFDVDFKESKTLNNINQWVSKKTEGMIDPFIDAFSNPEMLRLFLVNAVYFNGEWSIPFEPKDTRRDIFHGKNAERNVDMMFMNDTEFRYLKEHGIKGIEIPYGDGQIVMNVLIPEDPQNKTIEDLYNGLTKDELQTFLGKLDSQEKTEIGTLELPKFELEYGLEIMNGALKELGMKKAFEPGNADFGQISEEDLFISAVTHKAKIQVEEWGTKASAATGIEMEATSALLEEPLRFMVNVPFLFFIRDTQSDTILFMGEINQLEYSGKN